MLEFCVRGLHMSEGVALKRIQAAKTASKFPDTFALVAKGRLHLSAVCMLAPKLTPENAPGLLEAATHQSKTSIASLLAGRFPKPDLPTSIRPVDAGSYDPDHAAGDAPLFGVGAPLPPARVAPLSAESFELRCTLGKHLHEKLRYVQALLGSAVATHDIPAVLELALDALADAKEKQKFAVTSRPRKQKGAPRSRVATAPCAAASATCTSITSCHSPLTACRRPRTCGCGAPRTTGSRPNASSAGASWIGRWRRRGVLRPRCPRRRRRTRTRLHMIRIIRPSSRSAWRSSLTCSRWTSIVRTPGVPRPGATTGQPLNALVKHALQRQMKLKCERSALQPRMAATATSEAGG